MPHKFRIPLRVVFYREDGRWLARCLEFNLVGDGETQAEALAQLDDAICLQAEASLEHDNPRNLFSPADGRFLEMFAAGQDVMYGEFTLNIPEIEIEQTETREYSGSIDDFPAVACPA